MMTVKHIAQNADEYVYAAEGLRFTPQSGLDPATLWIYGQAGSDPLPITGGKVFVMNYIGKTVARYELAEQGAFNPPLKGSAADTLAEQLRYGQMNSLNDGRFGS